MSRASSRMFAGPHAHVCLIAAAQPPIVFGSACERSGVIHSNRMRLWGLDLPRSCPVGALALFDCLLIGPDFTEYQIFANMNQLNCDYRIIRIAPQEQT